MVLLNILSFFVCFTCMVSSLTDNRWTCDCQGKNNLVEESFSGRYDDTTSSSVIPLINSKGGKGDDGIPGKRGPVGLFGQKGSNGLQGTLGTSPPLPKRGELGSWLNPAMSCNHLVEMGFNKSGFYSIQLNEPTLTPVEVFCDLESAGGGWTLVASVHENNIGGKCTAGDKWSSEQRPNLIDHEEINNWENTATFGSALEATVADYKGSAYFSLNASDVMIWHVPNEVPLLESLEQATLRYYTDNGFLASYGGTLRNLYNKHFNVEQFHKDLTQIPITRFVKALRSKSTELQELVPGFYKYEYDSVDKKQINDGGYDMFDGGNKIYFQLNSNGFIQLRYQQLYKDPTIQMSATTVMSHPFHFLMQLGNQEQSISTIQIKVVSDSGADGAGSYTTYSGGLSRGNLSGYYQAYSVYGATDPSICEVFYYVGNVQDWQSVLPSSLSRHFWPSDTDDIKTIVQVDGSPKNILLGYFLLSKEEGVQVSQQETLLILNNVMDVIIANYREPDTLIVPINFLTGDNDTVMAGIPPNERPNVTPGYIEFRTFNENGIPSALCPGIKTKGYRPQYVCVGGINTITSDSKICGDFAGWEGENGNSPNDTTPHGSARSLNDVNSSILIFTKE